MMKTTASVFAFLFDFRYVLAVPYSEYILAPRTRDLSPVAVYAINGSVSNAMGITTSGSGSVLFDGTSHVTYDYGKNIAGVVSITVGDVSSSDATLALAYAEGSKYISSTSSDSLHDDGESDLLYLKVGAGAGTYSVSRDHEMGAFRYLTVIAPTQATIEVTSVITNFTAAPVNDLTAYTGYFHSDNELINRVWYAGAYTNQLCTIDPNYGDAFDGWKVDNGLYDWSLNTTITSGSSALVDGAKRDRVVWPGDMVISIPAIAVSTYDMQSIHNSIESLLAYQKSSGVLPYYGSTYGKKTHTYISYTYHLYTVVDLIYYCVLSGDQEYLSTNWEKLILALNWSLSQVDGTGLLNVTTPHDWGRKGMGGHNIEANAILYYTLQLAIQAASEVGETSAVANWTTTAENLKAAANSILWDNTEGLYRDNESSDLFPQDGNSWAVKANLTTDPAQNAKISEALENRWLEYGAPAPERAGLISPFISGFEVEAHLLSGNASRALDLLQLEWGYMLNNEYMTNSTFIEGYLATGEPSYSLYRQGSRVSHAHGWSTAPTSLLSTHIAGLNIKTSAGATWVIEPRVGYLKTIHAGFSTAVGNFSIVVTADGTEKVGSVEFCTPPGTTGVFKLDGHHGRFWESGSASSYIRFKDVTATLDGGCYSFRSS